VVELLLSKCEALSSSPSTAKKRKNKKKRIRYEENHDVESIYR
jgi:hypothetical protein